MMTKQVYNIFPTTIYVNQIDNHKVCDQIHVRTIYSSSHTHEQSLRVFFDTG